MKYNELNNKKISQKVSLRSAYPCNKIHLKVKQATFLDFQNKNCYTGFFEGKTTHVSMPERSEGIPFYFSALDMGVARFNVATSKWSCYLFDLNITLVG